MTQRILIAEDEVVAAFDLCDTVEEAGFRVEGPHAEIASAMLALQKHKPDLAILDIDLIDGNVFGLADTFAAEHVPIIFHSDREPPAELAERFPHATTLTKPCPPDAMLAAVSDVLAHCAAEA